jgi:outer membrane protein assembly factor BamC
MGMRMVAVLAAALAAGGCAGGMFDRKVDYKSAGRMPSLEIPPDLTAPAHDGRYAVPDTGRSSATLSGYQAERREQAGHPRNTSVLPQVERMRIERAGTQRWLVVQEPAEKVWPLVKEFWQEMGFLINTEVPEAGVLETDWAENRAKIPQDFVRQAIGKWLDQLYSTSERDKFRTRLDRTPDGKGTEIYISHRGMREVYATARDVTGGTGQTVWQPRDADPELEAEFLRRLMVRLGAPDEDAKLAATSASPMSLRAELTKGGNGMALLQVHEPFDRAWRRVGLALDRVGFTVEDRDRHKGLYFVRYADPEADMAGKDRQRGILSRLFSFGSSDPKVKAEQYRVEVRPDGQASQVHVLDKDGAAENTRTSQRILSLLHDQLK